MEPRTIDKGKLESAEKGAGGPHSGSTADTCRETLRISHDEQVFQSHLTLGIQEKLQKNRMIRNIKSQFRKPVDKQSLSLWERKNGVVLPCDLREYYQSTNGFKLTWSLEHAGDILPIGEMNINPLNQLNEIHSIAKQTNGNGSSTSMSSRSLGLSTRPKTCSDGARIQQSSSTLNSGRKQHEGVDLGANDLQLPLTELEHTILGSSGQTKLPLSGLSYNPDNKMFILDSGRSGWGKVCLVYTCPPSCDHGACNTKASSSAGTSTNCRLTQGGETRSETNNSAQKASCSQQGPYVEIWFMDPSFQWHFLAPTFTHFYRMLLFHLGLPQWQYRFTPFGLSSWAEQMFWLVAPHLLQAPKLSKFPSMYQGEGLWSTDVPSEAATPNPIPNILTNQLFRRKKKDKEKPQQT